MKKDNLYILMQNVALSTIALQGFVFGYYSVAKDKPNKETFPDLGQLFFVLPIVYHQSSMKTFNSSYQLYNAILSNNAIVLGLQDRANKMSVQTFDAINLGFSKKIFSYNKSKKQVELTEQYRSKKINLVLSKIDMDKNSARNIQKCAVRLGNIFAKRDRKNIQLELNIKF